MKKKIPFFYATFQCGRYNVFKKFFLFFFFDHKKLKKPPSKVAHNWPKPFFPQPSPKYHKNVPISVCSLVCDLTHTKKKLNIIEIWLDGPKNMYFWIPRTFPDLLYPYSPLA